MSLDDVKHVEAVAIMRTLIESPWGYGMPDELKQTAEAWLTENHPPPEAYMAAMRSRVRESPEMRCGLIMVGSGGDAWDPTCDLPESHPGVCKSYDAIDQHKLSRAPSSPLDETP
jgi:hypothetical protein